MGDFLKEIFDAANSRIRSPFLGSIFLVFLAINWQSVFQLLFADKPVLERLGFFNENVGFWTMYFFPILGGVVVALFLPWLKYVGAIVAAKPTRLLRNMQHDETQKRQIYELERSTQLEEAKARFDEAAETRAIEAARRRNEAKDTGDEHLQKSLEAKRISSEAKQELSIESLSELEIAIILFLGSYNQLRIRRRELAENAVFQDRSKDLFENYSERRLSVDTNSAVDRLEKRELLSFEGDGILTLTTAGFGAFDQLQLGKN